MGRLATVATWGSLGAISHPELDHRQGNGQRASRKNSHGPQKGGLQSRVGGCFHPPMVRGKLWVLEDRASTRLALRCNISQDGRRICNTLSVLVGLAMDAVAADYRRQNSAPALGATEVETQPPHSWLHCKAVSSRSLTERSAGVFFGLSGLCYSDYCLGKFIRVVANKLATINKTTSNNLDVVQFLVINIVSYRL